MSWPIWSVLFKPMKESNLKFIDVRVAASSADTAIVDARTLLSLGGRDWIVVRVIESASVEIKPIPIGDL